MRWIAVLLLPSMLLLAAACEGEDRQPTESVEAQPTAVTPAPIADEVRIKSERDGDGSVTETVSFWLTLVALLAAAGSIGAALTAFWQLRGTRKESRLRSVLEMAEANRDIIRIGLEYPDLFEIWETEPTQQEERMSRFSQIWINHAHVIWYRNSLGLMEQAAWTAVRADILSMFKRPVIKRRWEKTKSVYPEKFRSFIDSQSAR